jgi:hypothetical protein
MADPIQYSFTYGEIARLMFESEGIHEGKWVVGFEFNVTVAPVGLNPTEAFPGAIITANKFVLTAVGETPTPPNLTFDAAALNPRAPKPKAKPSK